MQLAKIKLAGFKSFVDPTVLDLPSNLVAIVGPNGCGKSNVIDAVTWVMGESSPKYLRGEALTDVIFNGSSARKPVGQASVELIFENTEGKISGEYAKYAEISVKRVINRDSDSVYYLNGARCRKKDIVDIFLGTGLGPRSYSIIGQNMITKIIEAKPDELRTYLEEAAGISKYKERRHETELRIKHTNENLDRVNDLRAELEKQLSSLKHQANVAEKFKSLKQQERVLKAELYTIQWRQIDSRLVSFSLQVQREETALEAKQSELSGTDKDLELLRHEQRVAHDSMQEVQRRYYSIGNEITRVEQDIVHHQERQQQWENDLAQVDTDLQSVNQQLTDVEEELRDFEHEIQKLEPQLTIQSREAEALDATLNDAEEAMQAWQQTWDEFNQLLSKNSQNAQVEKVKIQHLEQKIELSTKRLEQLQHEQTQFNFTSLNKEIEDYSQKTYELADKVEFQNKQLNEVKKEITFIQNTQQDATTNLNNVRNELQKLCGQQASLEALQQTALGQKNQSTVPWLKKHDLNNQHRLAQEIEVEKGWESAVEKVLGYCLQAVCVDDYKTYLESLDEFKTGNLCLVKKTTQKTSKSNHQNETLLLNKIKSTLPLESLLANIYVANDLNHALALCETLQPTESVVTQTGLWINAAWLKILREQDPAAGVFQREQELKELEKRIATLQSTQHDLEKNIANQKEKLAKLEADRDALQQSYTEHQSQAAQFNTQRKMKQERLNDLKVRSEKLLMEQEECDRQLGQAQKELVQRQSVYEELVNLLEEQTKRRNDLLSERDKLRENLSTIKENNQSKVDEVHSLEIRLQTTRSQKNAYQQNLYRLQQQLASLNERKITLQSELMSMQPIDTLKKSLSRSLDKHVSAEVELNTARVAVESLEQEFKNLEGKRQTLDREINKLRKELEELRVESQGLKVKSESILEQMSETEFKLHDVLRELPQMASPDEWQDKLAQVVQRINRLGPINLIAIEEYSTCLERKEYLDKQVDDLQAGLNTLQDAIAKIDKETRTRFKETFDFVNQRFQELFPTIFGGGRAYLELTEDDLLTAGVSVMACPPGKRNSSIYLLSGGEKSLTAVSLIFSIFHLNPAPFCLLDEVDAALDDANVVRFTNLVKSMAEKTQFLFISHNKITIEMAEHLIGVTMNEPGVSRLVSVDIEKAMTMAESG